MLTSSSPNRLIHSTSPYLLQHAHNPVDWHEWGAEALKKAKDLNKPILVSIGYSSCHWCHVMEREVFEKKDIADIMNEYMVCIKVDREERPDIDSIYMEAVQALGVHGGWPLNVFLTPDQKPFYGGTYFPPDQWVNVLRGIHKAFIERRKDIETSAEELTKALAHQDTSHFKKIYEFENLKTDLDKMYQKLSASFDRSWGGLDKAPKFVMPSVWLWLLRYQYLTGNEEALNHLKITLQRIGWGGIYDQIGGGFARYAVDGYWFVPHFEKMLYDNAQLFSLYAEAYAVTKDELFKTIVAETFDWLQGEMMHPEGAFYSALDADSEGEEGKFYIWTEKEVDEILNEQEAELFKDFFNIKTDGNWEHGNNVLMRTQPDDVFLKKYSLSESQWRIMLREMKDRLLEMRDKRIRPGLDDKIITSWNAMMIVGLSDAYRYIRDERYLQAALKNMAFLEKELMDFNLIYRSFKDKRSSTKGFLDDYAYVIQACIKLYQATFDESWIDKAKRLTEHVTANFLDKDDGFFFYTSNESEALIARRKEIFDNVIPSSNSVMVQNLFHLGTILDREEWKQLAEAITTPLAHLIVEEPNYMSNWGIAYLEIKKGLHEVVLSGNVRPDIFERYLPFCLWMRGDGNPALPLARGKHSIDNKPTIYVCFDKTCRRPVHENAEAIAEIQHANSL
jgi:uncharacterized protein